MDDDTLKRLGIKRGDSGRPPKVRSWARYGKQRIEAFGVQSQNRLEIHVDGKLKKTRVLKTPEQAEAKFFWAQYWARNAVDQFVIKLIKKATADKKKSGAIPKEPKTGLSFYTLGDKSVVLAHAPEGLARFLGRVGLVGFMVERETWKKGATAADAQKAAESLLKAGYVKAKPPAGLANNLGWRLKNLRRR